MPYTDKVKGLNANKLKLIAIVAMTLDHFNMDIFSGLLYRVVCDSFTYYRQDYGAYYVVFHCRGILSHP